MVSRHKHFNIYVHIVRLNEISSVVEMFYGLCTAPFSQFKSVVIDEFHAFYLGATQDIQDHAFRVLDTIRTIRCNCLSLPFGPRANLSKIFLVFQRFEVSI